LNLNKVYLSLELKDFNFFNFERELSREHKIIVAIVMTIVIIVTHPAVVVYSIAIISDYYILSKLRPNLRAVINRINRSFFF